MHYLRRKDIDIMKEATGTEPENNQSTEKKTVLSKVADKLFGMKGPLFRNMDENPSNVIGDDGVEPSDNKNRILVNLDIFLGWLILGEKRNVVLNRFAIKGTTEKGKEPEVKKHVFKKR